MPISNALLFVVAAPVEARAVALAAGADLDPQPPQWTMLPIGHRSSLLVTGVGKVNAAASVALALRAPNPPRRVINVGIAGVLPGHDLDLGSVVVGSASVYADEGVTTPDGFLDCAAMGFPLGPFGGSRIESAREMMSALAPFGDACAPIATVSTCSGTDELALQTARRTGAAAEAMEGAAVLHVCSRLGTPAIEVRVISNTTGDRPRQRWDIRGAAAELTAVIGTILAGPIARAD